MMRCGLLNAILSACFWAVAGVCAADTLAKDEVNDRIERAGQQVEVYLAAEPTGDLLDALSGLAERDLAVAILFSPDLSSSPLIVEKLTKRFASSPGDAPTICVLNSARGSTSVIVIDHVEYRDDFAAEEAVAFTHSQGQEWVRVDFPESRVLAEKTEALSGNCRT